MKAKFIQLFQSNQYSVIALTLLYLHTLTMIVNKDVSEVFQGGFLLLSLPILYIERARLYKDPMVIALGVMIVISILSWINSMIYYPEIANNGPKIDRVTKLFSFIFIAYWLKGKVRNINLLILCYLFGVLIAYLFFPDFFNETLNALNGKRADFGMKNAQYTAMLSGVSLILLICLFFTNKNSIIRANNNLKYLAYFFFILLFLFYSFLFVVSQARQAWLSMLILLLSFPFILFFHSNLKLKNLVSVYGIISLFLIIVYNLDIIQHRLSAQSDTIISIMNGNFENIPMDSVGIRVLSWLEAINWIKENPLLGLDSNAISQVIYQSTTFSTAIKNGYKHLHNYHIETLVSYGFLGLANLYFIYFWLASSITKIESKSVKIQVFIVLTWSFLIFWFIINLFETISGRGYGVFTHNILFGICYTFYLKHHLNRENMSM